MGKINILSAELSNKIAAGEVVERPSSVVKELVENSIDAGSTNIKIIIQEFGIKQIRIIDNGSGISNDDLERAFLRHATSKISADYDLFHIETLGFRGEALASISSVSKVTIKSCSGEVQGKMLILEGGKVVQSEFYAPIKGTDLSVENLFYNTPARLKYLRNPHTEQANITNVIHKFALSYPNISFELHVDGKITFKTYGDGDVHKILSKIYNMSVAKNMIDFSGSNDDYKVYGFISVPEETRASKNYIHIFINGRYIKNYVIQNSIIDAYGTLLMKNRYPLCVMNIEMDPILLDVNVHPTKQEVRLSKEAELIRLIKEIIAERLSNYTYIPQGMNNVLTKKEKSILLGEKEKLERFLGGVKNLPELPGAMFVIDPRKEKIAVNEAKKLGIPVVAVVDTNCDPDDIDYVIPGNDDAIRAVKLLTSVISDAVNEAKQGAGDAAQVAETVAEEEEISE